MAGLPNESLRARRPGWLGSYNDFQPDWRIWYPGNANDEGERWSDGVGTGGGRRKHFLVNAYLGYPIAYPAQVYVKDNLNDYQANEYGRKFCLLLKSPRMMTQSDVGNWFRSKMHNPA